MKIGSCFSGVGGLEYGLECAGLGETVWQIEIDPFCREILAKHWPNAKRYEDITKCHGQPSKEVPGELARVDLICGGFP